MEKAKDRLYLFCILTFVWFIYEFDWIRKEHNLFYLFAKSF